MKSQIFLPNNFQSEALKEIDKAIRLENLKAFLIVMPPGTGKTYLAAQWFRLQLKKNPKARLLFVCHNQDILSQANDKEFANCLSEFDIPRGYYNRYEKNIGQVTFATVQTLRKNLDKLSPDYFDYIIVDEAHHYRAISFEKTIKHFTPKVLIGLTATPYRMDGKSILNVFGKIIYKASINGGIKNGLLSKIKYYYVDNDIDFAQIKRDSHGKYDKKDLNKKLCIKEYDNAIIKEYNETVKHKYGKKKTICFCPTIEHVYRMEKLFNENEIRAVALAAKHTTEKNKQASVPGNKRKNIIDSFRKGEYDIIFVRDLFNEGMDIPDADCIMMMRPTESSRIFTQQIGRGLRISKDKDYLLVLDFTGNCFKCNINYEVLSEIIELDIVENIKKGSNNCNSELIIQNLGCEVRFSKKEIDLIIKSKSKEKEIVTKEKLIENYFNIKNKLGRIPTFTDFANGISYYSYRTYQRIFGSWNNFLISINEKFLSRKYKPTEQELIENYFQLKRKLGRQPIAINITKKGNSTFSYNQYLNCFGSWLKFLKKIGEPIPHDTSISEKDLIDNYLNMKNRLNSVPKYKDFKKYSKYSIDIYSKRFGSFNKFLLKMGEKPKHEKLIEVSDEDLIRNYWELKKKYPNLTSRMVTIKNGSQYTERFYYERFGSWENFLKTIGEKSSRKRPRISDKEIIDNYLEVKNKLKRIPTILDMEQNGKFGIGLYVKRFRGWNNFLFEMGDRVNKNIENNEKNNDEKNNITLISEYTPKNPLPNLDVKKSDEKQFHINGELLSGYKYAGGADKDNIRNKIIEKIRDDDTVLMLESPELEALKEIEKQGKNPKKIIIPNHIEFDKLATALNTYNTNLTIKAVNTSALQYIVDHPEESFNFMWLDYCGAFSYYIRDLETLLQREISDMRLILTYNIFDPKKYDESYYFANVISYVLKKLKGKNEILLIEDVSNRYKKTMYSVGFDISPIKSTQL